MRPLLIALGLAAAAQLTPLAALAQPEQAGVPLTPGEAAGSWTVASGGRWVCVVGFTRTRTALGYALRVPPACASVLPAGIAAWAPTPDGMSLIGADGGAIDFDRWSNSLLVSRQDSGVDISISRGTPNG